MEEESLVTPYTLHTPPLGLEYRFAEKVRSEREYRKAVSEGMNDGYVVGFMGIVVILLVLLVRAGAFQKKKRPPTPAEQSPQATEVTLQVASPQGHWERVFYSGVNVYRGQDITLFAEPDLDGMILTRYRRYSSFVLRCLGEEGDFFRVLFRKWQWFDPEIPTYDVAYIHKSECSLAQVSESVFYESEGEHIAVSHEQAPNGISPDDARIYMGLYYVRPLPEKTARIEIRNLDQPQTQSQQITTAEPCIVFIPPQKLVILAGAEMVLHIDAAGDDASLIVANDHLPEQFAHMQRQDPRGIIVGMIENA